MITKHPHKKYFIDCDNVTRILTVWNGKEPDHHFTNVASSKEAVVMGKGFIDEREKEK